MSKVTSALKKAAQSEDTPQRELKALAQQHVDLARLIARNPAASGALLRQLGSHADATVRKWVASHPATPTEVLLALGQQFPEQLLANPILDFLFLENPDLLSDFPDSTIRALMKRRSTPEAILRFGAQSRDEATQLAVVQNPSSTEDLLTSIHKKAASSKVKDAIKVRQQAEPDAVEADEIFWREVCARVAVYSPKKKERQLFEEVCVNTPAAGDPAAWLQRWERANAASISETDSEAFADERNLFIVEDLLARTDLPVSLMLRLIPRASTASVLNLTKNKTQAPAVLRALAEQDEEKVRVAVVKHPCTPEFILENLSGDKNSAVRVAVASHPKTPSSTLVELAYKRPDEMELALGGNKNTPDDALKALIQLLSLHPETKSRGRGFSPASSVVPHLHNRGFEIPYLIKVERYAFIKNPKAPTAVLEWLALSKDYWNRREAAEHPNTPIAVLKRLAGDKEWSVRSSVAENPNTPIAVLKQLAGDDRVRRDVAENPNTPAAVLGQLAGDKDKVAENPNTPAAVLEQLAGDKSRYVRRGVAENPNTPVAVLGQLVLDKEEWVRGGVAKNLNTPVAVLGQLVLDKEEYVRRGVAENLNTPVDVLERLVLDKKEYVRNGVAENLNTPVDVLERLVLDKKEYVRNGVAENLNTPVDVLERLVLDKKEYVRRGVAKNPNTPVAVLGQLVLDKDEWVRRGVAENLNTPVAVLERLVLDKKEYVRNGVAENLNTPVDVLERLVLDKKEWVGGAAASNPNAYVLFDDIMQRKTLKTGVFTNFLRNPNIIPKLEPYLPDFLRLLESNEPSSVSDEG